MPDGDDIQDGKQYHIGVPSPEKVFFLKGGNNLDWGMKNRLAQVFNPTTGRTVMLAVDHGYFQGPTTGLERIDLKAF
jgi:putative autoinducer-2 (AI-2) aldolase